MPVKKILIDGEWLAASDSFTVKNPFTNQAIAEVAAANRSATERAISAAENVKRQLKELPRFEIAKALRKIAAAIEKRREEFAQTICAESAKPILAARGEVERGIATFEWAAGEAERFAGEVVPVDTVAAGKGKWAYTERIPRGVIYGITPFNFPLNLVAHKVAPALAAKNPIIIKPSPRTPLTALLLGEAFLESDLPRAALQIVTTDVKDLDLIYADERVAMISFTGSAAVGWEIKSKAGKKAVALELGGSAPVIVDESADINLSLNRTTFGAFAYAGQVCISVQRVYIQEKIFDEWMDKFAASARKLKIGNPMDESTELSAMITEAAAANAEKMIAEATANGAQLLTGGKREGAILEATVLTKTSPEMRVVSEEAFAPLAIVEKFSDFDEAINLANQSQYGLQAGVFTNNFQNMQRAAQNLEYGGVIVNDVPTFRVDNMPYGGVKNSGFGREGVRYAMEEMSEIRLIVINS